MAGGLSSLFAMIFLLFCRFFAFLQKILSLLRFSLLTFSFFLWYNTFVANLCDDIWRGIEVVQSGRSPSFNHARFFQNKIRRDIEVVITALTRNQVYSNVPRVRIPLSPPIKKDTARCPFLLVEAECGRKAFSAKQTRVLQCRLHLHEKIRVAYPSLSAKTQKTPCFKAFFAFFISLAPDRIA